MQLSKSTGGDVSPELRFCAGKAIQALLPRPSPCVPNTQPASDCDSDNAAMARCHSAG
ncbi:Uncharacterised protein [Vibrio cholerae]|nr:Uncharacterised protein [Vibrio cholerae]CSB80859.1 Uncharacterised protein [Vibrio cholerae]